MIFLAFHEASFFTFNYGIHKKLNTRMSILMNANMVLNIENKLEQI